MGCFRVTAKQSGRLGISVASCLLAVVALLMPFPIQGQAVQGPRQNPSDSATLQGAVRDSTGRPVVGATVYLQAKDGTQTLSVHADATGSYRFSGLHEGIYMLRVEMAGYSQATIGPCVLGPKEAKKLDLTLESPKGSQAQASSLSKPGEGPPEFFDEPQFTVAGVTDGTNLGGHGSNTIVRTKESLAKDIAALSVSGDKRPASSLPPTASTSVDPAEMSLRATAEREPEDFEANHRLGKLLVDHGKAPEARVYLERAAQVKPADYENAYLLALAYADAGQYQLARTNARALLTAQEKDRPGIAQQDQAELHHLLGDIEEKSGDPLESVREYQRAAELNPSEPNFFDWGAELLLHRAAEPAIEVFSKGNRLFPHSARMLVALGVAWYSNGSYDQAAQRLCEASDLNPGDPEPYLFLGKMQSVESNQSECSVARLRRFVKLQPGNALANYYYGVNLWKRRKGPDDAETVAQAESLLKRADQLDPTLGVGYLQLGVLYSERKDFSRAISSYQDAIQASPQLEEAHYRLAQAYKRAGEKVKAEEELRLYDQISKSKDEEVERERRESRQFVYTLRSPTSGAQSR
jgi:tetratricopeptide (TPR) repeat protein